jgi:hypothetical protein
MVASATPESLETKLTAWEAKLDTQFAADETGRSEAQGLITSARALLGQADTEADALVLAFQRANEARGTGVPEIPSDDSLESKQAALATILRRLFSLFGEEADESLIDRAGKLQEIAAQMPTAARSRANFVRSSWETNQIIGKAKFGLPKRELYESGVLAGSETAAIAWISNDQGRHQQILDEYLAVNPGASGFQTDRFADFVFVATAAGHGTRQDFLERMGEPAADQLKTRGRDQVAASDLGDTAKQETLEQINQINYTNAVPPLGKFQNLPGTTGGQVDPDLRAAVDAAGVLRFMRDMVQRSQSGNISWDRLQELWTEDTDSRDFLKSRFRDVAPGMHEWIPTNYIPNVLQRAIEVQQLSQSGLREALMWIEVYTRLRSPTNHVLFHMVSRTFVGVEAGPPTVEHRIEPSGHTGAHYEIGDPSRNVLDFRQTRFHDQLRELFDQNSGLTALQFVRVLRSQLWSLVWNGDLSGVPDVIRSQKLSVLTRTNLGDKAQLSLHQLADEQAQNYLGIIQTFTAVLAQAPNLSLDEL